MEIKILNTKYKLIIQEEPDEYMLENSLQAYCNYNELLIIISKTYPDGDIKSKQTLLNDLLHEMLHAYFTEIGVAELNNERTIDIITALVVNQDIIETANKTINEIL